MRIYLKSWLAEQNDLFLNYYYRSHTQGETSAIKNNVESFLKIEFQNDKRECFPVKTLKVKHN